MHKERIFVLAGAVLGILSIFLPWRWYIFFNTYGNDHWSGYVVLGLFVIIGILGVAGKPEEPISKGAQKMTIMALAGLLLLLFLVLLVYVLARNLGTPMIGYYLALVAALDIVILPFIIKDSGEMAMPTAKEFADEIEDNADVLEDQVEDVADKIEDKFEEIEDKIEDRFDEDDDEKKSSEEE